MTIPDKLWNAFQSWQDSHTEEDKSKLMKKIMSKADRRYKARQDRACRNGNHGFYLKSQVSGGYIYTQCSNCGAYFETPDRPFY